MAGEDFGHTPGADGEGPVRCSFCGKTQDQVRKLVRGHDGMFICDECVEACNEILEQSFAQDEMMRAFGAAYAAQHEGADEPVSYTHLDVYKRQASRRAGRRMSSWRVRRPLRACG